MDQSGIDAYLLLCSAVTCGNYRMRTEDYLICLYHLSHCLSEDLGAELSPLSSGGDYST